MRISALVVALALVGCKKGDDGNVGEDLDGDGFTVEDDCNDTDPSIRPGATEQCNDVDDDCDSQVDEGLRDDFFRDVDGDGFGDDGDSLQACVRPGGYSAVGGDCDDADSTAFPGNIELCDGVDHDCDGSLTEGAAGNITFYRDSDGDGFGDDDETQRACAAPSGFSQQGGDCDDTVQTVNPAAAETCNEIDDDCNGLEDDNASDAQPFSYDQDGDGYGIIGATVSACGAGQNVDVDGNGTIDAVTVAAALATDCNDANSTISPIEPERCDGIDTDCNPATDEDLTAVDTSTWLRDADGDGAVISTDSTLACSQPFGYGPDDAAEDCDDTDPLITPYGPELCDTIDNDCDGLTDEPSAADATPYYQDLDADGFGDPTGPVVPSCAPLANFVDNDFDCDDQSTAVGAPPPQFADLDEDGYGDPNDAEIECAPIDGRVLDDQDCDDLNAAINPETVWYADIDGDGYGVSTDTLAACLQPDGYAALPGDCADGDPDVRPGVADTCNGTDDDCDGETDEDCVVEHCGLITADEVWATDLIHLVTCDVRVQGTGAPRLTIEGGADVRFVGDAQLIIGQAQTGTLVVDGAGERVTMRSSNLQNPGLWGGVLIGPRANAVVPSSLTGLTVLDAGADGYGIKIDDVVAELDGVEVIAPQGVGVLLEDDAVLSMVDSLIENADGVGLQGGSLARIVEFTNNTIIGSTAEPVIVAIQSAEVLDTTSLLTPNGVEEIGVLGGTLTTSATLDALDVPYRVDATVTVAAPASPVLTLEDGVDLLFRPGAALAIGTNLQPGTLLVEGTTEGVTMGPVNPAQPWGGISLGQRSNPALASSLVGLSMSGAGSASYGVRVDGVAVTFADVEIDGTSGTGLVLAGAASVSITDSAFTGNSGQGVRGVSTSRVPVFQGNTLTGNGAEPLVIDVTSVGNLDDTSTFASNGTPAIGVLGGTLTTSTLVRDLDAPYRVDGTITVGGGTTPVLTLEAGTEMSFAAGAQLAIATTQPARLLATDATLTAAGASPWGGILVGPNDVAASPSVLDGVTVRGAGSGGFGVRANAAVLQVIDSTVENTQGQGISLLGASELALTGSTIRNNSGVGVSSNAASRLTAFSSNTLTGNGAEPLIVDVTSIGRLDGTSVFTPNTTPLVGVLGGTLASTTLISDLDAPYRVDGNVSIGAASTPVVTIATGTELRFGTGVQLQVSVTQPGRLVANGALMVPAGGSPWGGILVGPNDAPASPTTLTNVTVRGAGSAGYGVRADTSILHVAGSTIEEASGPGISLVGASELSLTGSTVRNNQGAGVNAAAASRITAFSNNVLTGNAGEALIVPVASVGVLDSASTYLPNGVPVVGVLGGTLSANTTMAALGPPANRAPYRVDGDIVVAGGTAPALTIQSGAELRFTGSAQLVIGSTAPGTLLASGVLMRSSNILSPSPWGGVVIGPNFNPVTPSSLAAVTIQDAGADGFGLLVDDATVQITGSTIADTAGTGIRLDGTATLQLSTSTIRDNDGVGVLSNPSSRITLFAGNTLTGNDDEPLIIDAPSVGAVNATSSFSPNGTPVIGVLGGTIANSTTLSEVNVDYRIDGDLFVAGGSAPVLTVQDGVRAEFAAGAGLSVGVAAQGALMVQGAVNGVEFGGTVDAPGHWEGVTLGVNANDSVIQGLDLQHGGGNSRGNLYLTANSAVAPDQRKVMRLVGVTSSNSSNNGLFAERVKLEIESSEFTSNLQYGAQVLDVVFDDSSIDSSLFANNQRSGVRISPHLVELLVGAPRNAYSGNVFPIEVIAGTVPESALWQPLDEDYYLVGVVDVQFQDESVLTLAEGTKLWFAPTGRLRIGNQFQGSLVVDGTPANPVEFDAITVYQGLPTPRGSYPGLYFGNFQRTSRLDNLIVRNAGSTVEGSIYAQGVHPNPIELDEVTVEDSGADGIRATSGSVLWIHDSTIVDGDDYGVSILTTASLVNLGAGTRSFTNNVITGNALEAMQLPANSAGQLDPSSTFDGNNDIVARPDRVLITGNVTRTQTWMDIGVPYWAQSEIEVGDATSPILTLEPGVAVHFRAGSDDRLYVGPLGDDGGILAIGTLADPVVFTSDEDYVGGDPLPGDWGGVELGPDCIGPVSCVLQHVRVDYAGSIQEEGAIMVATRRSIPALTQVRIQNVRQRFSASSGLQFQAEAGVVSPVPTPWLLPFPYLDINDNDMLDPGEGYPFACEDVLPGPAGLDGNCENLDYCWDGNSHGDTNVFCGNGEANVSARNFANPFVWLSCNDVGLDDGPVACP